LLWARPWDTLFERDAARRHRDRRRVPQVVDANIADSGTGDGALDPFAARTDLFPHILHHEVAESGSLRHVEGGPGAGVHRHHGAALARLAVVDSQVDRATLEIHPIFG